MAGYLIANYRITNPDAFVIRTVTCLRSPLRPGSGRAFEDGAPCFRRWMRIRYAHRSF